MNEGGVSDLTSCLGLVGFFENEKYRFTANGICNSIYIFVKEGETKWNNLTCFSCCRERLRCGSLDLAKGPSPLFFSTPTLPHAA